MVETKQKLVTKQMSSNVESTLPACGGPAVSQRVKRDNPDERRQQCAERDREAGAQARGQVRERMGIREVRR